MGPRGAGGTLPISNSTAAQHSPLVGAIFKINNLLYSCFVQHRSLKSPPCYLCARTLPCVHPRSFLQRPGS